jgi:hypothetical protein
VKGGNVAVSQLQQALRLVVRCRVTVPNHAQSSLVPVLAAFGFGASTPADGRQNRCPSAGNQP